MWDTMSWDVRPHRVISRKRDYNDHIVFAVTSPTEDSARIHDRRSNTLNTVEIELLIQDKIDEQAGRTGMRTYQPPQIEPSSSARHGHTSQPSTYEFGSRDADDYGDSDVESLLSVSIRG